MKYKVPANITNASKLLLKVIIKKYGGSTKVGDLTGFTRQAVHNFETEGYVPLIQVYSIAKALKLKVWHLSYFKLMEVFGPETPDFEVLVKRLSTVVLDDDDKEKILKVYKK